MRVLFVQFRARVDAPFRIAGVLRNGANPPGFGFVRANSGTNGYSIVEDQWAKTRSERALLVRYGFLRNKANRVTGRYFPTSE